MRSPSAELLAELGHYYQGATEPNIYWYLRCLPTCHANSILAVCLQLETRLVEYGVPRPEIACFRLVVWQAFEEIDTAWQDLDR